MRSSLGAVLALAACAAAAQQPANGAIEFARVPAGCFDMGSEFGEKHEKPVHKVCVKAFDMGKYEVTQGQWKAVMQANPSKFPLGDDHPVENVSWNDAQEFLRRISARDGATYRLPTEAEWEYACRGAGKHMEYAGEVGLADVHQIAWFNKDEVGNRTHPVGRKQPNALGLYDMNGNVWEWTQDFFVTPYGGDKKEAKYVLRGGSWDGKVRYVRCAIRNRNEADRRDPRLGLRVVREVAAR
jgi:formylglycine-generating enzyme